MGMKITLILVMCSALQNTCLPPFTWETTFSSYYDCLQFGYDESKNKLKEIGDIEVNKHQIYIKFGCQETKSTEA